MCVCIFTCICVPVHTQRPAGSIQCPPLSCSTYPFEAELRDTVYSSRLEVSALSNPPVPVPCGTGVTDRHRTLSLLPGF